MFGLSLGVLMAPLAVQEMVMAAWLIAMGFTPRAAASGPAGATAPAIGPSLQLRAHCDHGAAATCAGSRSAGSSACSDDEAEATHFAARLRRAVAVGVAVARPTGVGRALATYEIPIEGRDEWVAAARRLA